LFIFNSLKLFFDFIIVSFTINTPSSQPQTAVAEDPMEKLTKLKTMLDNGILTQEEFDTAKKDILSKM